VDTADSAGIQELAGLSRWLVNYHFASKVALVAGVISTIRECSYSARPDVSQNDHEALSTS
jgi:hypothetical protein